MLLQYTLNFFYPLLKFYLLIVIVTEEHESDQVLPVECGMAECSLQGEIQQQSDPGTYGLKMFRFHFSTLVNSLLLC